MAITIDDGSASIASLFEPRAAAAGLSYAVALVTGWVDEDKAQVIDMGGGMSDEILTWREVKALARTPAGWNSFPIPICSTATPRRAATEPTPDRRSPRGCGLRRTSGSKQKPERQRRVFADLAQSRQAIAGRLGRAPATLVWPYGIYDAAAESAAKEAGFTHFMQFTGNAFAAPRRHAQRIMRVAVTAGRRGCSADISRR